MGIGDYLDLLNELILEAASGWWTLIGLFVFCVGDGFLPILPSDTLVVGLGSVQGQPGTPHWIWVILVAAAGAVLGDAVAYQLGRLIGGGMLEGRGRFGWMRKAAMVKTLLWARHELDKRGVFVIFVGRFIPGGRVAINFVAGVTGFSFWRFLIIDAVASLVWASWLTGLGIAGTAIFGNMLIAMPVAIAVAVLLGWVFERVFRLFTAWLDRKGVQLDPEGYQDTADADIEPPIHLRRRREEDEDMT